MNYNTEQLVSKLIKFGIVRFDTTLGNYYIDEDVELQNLRKSLGFEDVAIYQKKNMCKSRLDADISSEVFRGVSIDVPLIASNMATVCNADFCIELYKLGALGVLHRASSDERIVKAIKKVAKECDIVCSSVGVGDRSFELFKKSVQAGMNVVFVDIAHGFSEISIEMCKKMKAYSPEVKVVIGNTINPDLMYEVDGCADAVKIGIAQGLACETKNTAGCTEKQFSAVFRFKRVSRELGIPIISDGGVREPADATKAIGAGANSIMAGSVFARCPESAAEETKIDGVRKKIYAGMASRYQQEKWRGGLKSGTCPEGGIILLDVGESIGSLIERYSGALRSGITYSGGVNIKTFQDNVEFIRV